METVTHCTQKRRGTAAPEIRMAGRERIGSFPFLRPGAAQRFSSSASASPVSPLTQMLCGSISGGQQASL